MERKKVILLIAALLIAVITIVFIARGIFSDAPPPAATAARPAESSKQILVATRALPVGTIISAGSFRYQPWPDELVEDAYFVKGTESAPSEDQLIGAVVRYTVTAGQPITKGTLVSPGDRGFLAAALGPGMRAVSIPVSALTGVSGFVFPGDRVDLVLTQNVPGNDGPPLKVSETFMRNLRVLATDQRSTAEKDEKGNTVVSQYRLVTLEATPNLAEKITVAQAIGTISLSLRSLADDAAELEQALASGSINIPKDASPEEEAEALRSIAQTPTAGKSTYATGGEVSRFQRSSVPAQMMLPKAREAAVTAKVIEKIQRGPVVRVSRGGAVTEVLLDKR